MQEVAIKTSVTCCRCAREYYVCAVVQEMEGSTKTERTYTFTAACQCPQCGAEQWIEAEDLPIYRRLTR